MLYTSRDINFCELSRKNSFYRLILALFCEEICIISGEKMLFDTHIHLDQFSDQEIKQILQQPNLEGVLAVATDLASCERLLALKERYSNLYIAAGFHPEQALPSESGLEKLFDFIAKNHQKLTACGEVGLPHYLNLKRENPTLDY